MKNVERLLDYCVLCSICMSDAILLLMLMLLAARLQYFSPEGELKMLKSH